MSSPETTPGAEMPPLPPPAEATPTLRQPAPRTTKSPWIALLLSLLMPGLGQIYNGQFAKALSFFVAFSGSIYLISQGHGLPFGIFLPFLIFWNMIDAYRSAEGIDLRGMAVAAAEPESPGWGIGLAVMGLLLLLNNMGWLHLAAFTRFWPVLLIAAGLVLLRRSMQRRGSNGPVL